MGGFQGFHVAYAQQAQAGHLLLGKTWHAIAVPLFGHNFNLIQIFTMIACIGVVLATAYSLYLVKRVFTGKPSAAWGYIKDINMSEYVVLGTLAVISLVLGFFPNAIIQSMGFLFPHQLPMGSAQLPSMTQEAQVSQAPVSPSIALKVVR